MDLNHRPPPCQGGEHSAAPREPNRPVLPVGIEPTASAASERRALRCSTGEAPPTGLEPVLSAVTGRRPLQLVHGSETDSRDGWIRTSVLVRPRHATTPGWSTSR